MTIVLRRLASTDETLVKKLNQMHARWCQIDKDIRNIRDIPSSNIQNICLTICVEVCQGFMLSLPGDCEGAAQFHEGLEGHA